MNNILRDILCLLFILLLCAAAIFSCHGDDDINEIDIMNTVCDEGVKKISVINMRECYYHAVEINGETVKCDEEETNLLQPLRIK